MALPEVEGMRRDLEHEVVGKKVKDVTVRSPAIVARHRTRPEFVKALTGRRLDAVARRGVHLLVKLDDGGQLVLRPGSHASLIRQTASAAADDQVRLVVSFTTGGALHYADAAKDGSVFVLGPSELGEMDAIAGTGVDPLVQTFTWTSLAARLEREPRSLKALLLDDSFIVGLGDVYSDEILWAAGLAGAREAPSLSGSEVRRLHRSITEVLHEAVKAGGSTEPVEVDPIDGFAEWAETGGRKVWGMVDRPCPRCRRPIALLELPGELVTYACRQCQT